MRATAMRGGEMMHRRQICERSVCDGGIDDPRVLVHRYQQKMRAELLARAAHEARRKRWHLNCLSAIAELVTAGLRTMTTRPEPHPAPIPARLTPIRMIPSAQPAF